MSDLQRYRAIQAYLVHHGAVRTRRVVDEGPKHLTMWSGPKEPERSISVGRRLYMVFCEAFTWVTRMGR